MNATKRMTRPIRRSAQEAIVALLRSADTVRRKLTEVVEPYGVTFQQYNVLRILRGAHPDPLPTLEIGERMIERTPGVTRLVDRLEEKGWVRREACPGDRRIVYCRISEAGLELLAAMDDAVDAADEAVVAGLERSGRAELVRLLERLHDGPLGNR
ncbi:MAG: MarR family winged helix-turn-helix transcriptional regulator [Gemmatimonadota bacterium]